MKTRFWMFVLGVVVVVSFVLLIQKPQENMNLIKETEESSETVVSEEEVIKLFFNLIDEDRSAEAVMMMTPEIVNNESVKQAWGVQFAAFESIRVVSLEKWETGVYRVVLDTVMKPEAGLIESIPYYGYGDGEFTRWVGLEEVGGMWKISGLATGP